MLTFLIFDIFLKGQIMAAYKPGLHKDVEIIFNGVWNAKVDNIQQYITPVGRTDSGRSVPKPLVSAHPAEKAGISQAGKSADSSQKQDWNRRFLLSPKKRRERKRLLSISRYLNLPLK